MRALQHVPEKFESQTFFGDQRYVLEQLCKEISLIGLTSRSNEILAWTRKSISAIYFSIIYICRVGIIKDKIEQDHHKSATVMD